MANNQQELLTQFARFIEFLENPAQYKALVNDAKETLESLHAERELHRKIKDIDVFLKEGSDRLEQGHKSLSMATEHFESKKQSQEKAFQEKTKKLDSLLVKNEQLQKELEHKAQIFDQQQETGRLLDARQKRLDAFEHALKKLEQDLTSKREAVNKLLGD